MNKPINYELAKLLKEKGFNELCSSYYLKSDIEPIETNVKCSNNRIADSCYTAPTIAEVVMWLYEKYKIWIQACISKYGIFYCNILKKENTRSLDNTISWKMQAQLNDFKSPTEAYEAAIEYCLNNLIN